MKQKTQLSNSVIANFPEGTIKTFNNLAEASAYCKLTEA